MLKHLVLASTALVTAPLWVTAAAAQDGEGLTPQEREAILLEIRDMRARIDRLEASLEEGEAPDAGAPPAAAPGAPSAAPPSGTPVAARQAPDDHNLELYGFLQLDAIQDFNRVHPAWDATLRPSRIPTTEGQYGGDGQSVFSVRQSRLGAKATGMLAGKPYEAKFEFDLFGTGVDEGQTTFRVRHMYAKWGPILAGQTNTLFMDGDTFPNVVDYWGPAGMVFVRTPQLRFTVLEDMNWNVAVALEHPSDDIDTGNLRLIDEDIAANIQANEEIPDLTGAIRYGGEWGHFRLAGMLRKIGYETKGTVDNEPSGHETGWGLNGSTAIKLSPATLKASVAYGRGIATYMNDGGMDLAPSVTTIMQPPNIILVPEAEAVKLLGVMAYVDFDWSKEWTSSIGYSFTEVDNTNFQDPTAFHKGEYASVNALWHPAGNIFIGPELLWGQRTDNDGDKGDDLRLQVSFNWAFSSKNIWSYVD